MLRHLFVCALEVRFPCFRRALFGVVRSPQTVLRRWWINVASAVSLIESSQKIGRSHHRHRPGRDVFPAVLREPFDLVIARYAATSFFDQLNSVPPSHIRCRMTASLRATATVAFRIALGEPHPPSF
jgi:hypothetical protein